LKEGFEFGDSLPKFGDLFIFGIHERKYTLFPLLTKEQLRGKWNEL
jgi:hypothetical protein